MLHGDDMGSGLSMLSEGGENAVIQWAASSSAVLERECSVSLILMRTGNLSNRALVRSEAVGLFGWLVDWLFGRGILEKL